MPVAVERRLKKQAEKLHLKGDRKRAYIFGTLKRIEKASDKK
jgi:hypothetical protein